MGHVLAELSYPKKWRYMYACSCHDQSPCFSTNQVLCLSPGCQIRVWVRVITSKSESESASPSQTFFSSPSHNPSSPHSQHLFIFQNMKQTTKCIECQSKQCNTARPQLLGLGRDSGPSHDFWVRVRVKVKKLDLSPSPSPYSSHTSLALMHGKPTYA